jgi:DNA-binding transcriptional LysR family regulator
MAVASTRLVELFVTAVEAGNFTRAAQRLGVTPAAVSRAIGRHEAALGVRLFRRTTRSVRLTDDGQAYYERCRQALALIDDAERELGRRRASPHGLVRLSVPTTYGHSRVLPVVARFREAHPEVAVEVDVSNRNVDFVTEGYDLAIRAGQLDDSELIAHKLEDATLGVFASPAYLARHGTPRRVEDLARHTRIAFVRPSTGRVVPWIFRRRGGADFAITPGSELRCSDDYLACITLCRSGAGLAQIYHFLAEPHAARGELVEVLRPLAGRSWPFTLLQPPRRTPTQAVRLLVDAILADAHGRRAPRATGGSGRA